MPDSDGLSETPQWLVPSAEVPTRWRALTLPTIG